MRISPFAVFHKRDSKSLQCFSKLLSILYFTTNVVFLTVYIILIFSPNSSQKFGEIPLYKKKKKKRKAQILR